jgi:hypothetical protein
MNNHSNSLSELTQEKAEFDAPWGISLILVTLFASAVLIGVASIPLFTGPAGNIFWVLIMSVMPLSILFTCSLFMIRGFVLSNDTLIVKRLFWNTDVSLSGLESATVDPKAMKGSIRTCGNGGLFSFTGEFLNKKLGNYRAFVTSPKLAVVLRFTDKVIVVTPSQPDEFVSFLSNK